MLEDVRLFGQYGPFKIVGFRGSAGDLEEVVIVAFDEYEFRISTDPSKDKCSLLLKVKRHSDLEAFLVCGSRNGVFPGYLLEMPLTGQDAHAYIVGDYDMDGVFETRLETSATIVGRQEAESQSRTTEERSLRDGGR
jgi:hypothetical protein